MNVNFKGALLGVQYNGGLFRSLLCFLCLSATLGLFPARANLTPRIDFIEPFLVTNVLIHFDTEANRAYTLQYTETLPLSAASVVSWTNLYTAPVIPFANHYVVLDTAMRRQRFYRLVVSP